MHPPADLTAIVAALGEDTPAHLLLLFDFDGTLAEFAPSPEAARLTAVRRGLVAQLASRPLTTVGVVSGRRLDDVRDKVGLGPPVYFAGLHGMEIEGDGERFFHEGLRSGRAFVQEFRQRLEAFVSQLAGVMVEDKEYSVVLHWRQAAPTVKTEAAQRLSMLSDEPRRTRRIRLQHGHEMCEVLPNVSWNKGDAVRWIERTVLARQHGELRTMYVGDDLTDEAAFEAIAGRGIGVLVGQRQSTARFALPDPPAVEALLRMLVAMPLSVPASSFPRTRSG
jgi:trehalose-phosphatase